jgi:hypothetical protein
VKSNLTRIAATTRLVGFVDCPRIFPAKHRATPIDTGFGSSRFSSPSKSFRVLYAADAFAIAFAEAVVRDRFQDKTRRYLSQPVLEGLVAAEISTKRPLQLVDLRGPAAYELGIDTDTKGARAHTAGQMFAETLHTRTEVDGILFSSRLTATDCVAIFDRAFPALTSTLPVDLLTVAALPSEIARLGIVVRHRRRA